MIEIYTDGAYNPIQKQGGWVAVVLSGKKSVLSGVAKGTTSNRMEITAVLEGILHTPLGSEIIVYTDSQYVLGCMTQGWRKRANLDLWEQLEKAAKQRKVRWEWIASDAENSYHQEAHALAKNLASKGEAVKAQSSEKVLLTAELTHVDAEGRPRMVDVTAKKDTSREAVARCQVRMQPETLARLKKGDMPKGDVLVAAQLAGIMAAKKVPELIPLCHPLLLGDIKVEFKLNESSSTVEITSTVKSIGKTGVEMEALTAAAVSALTIYDMCKAIDRGMRMDNLRLIRKSGGKSGSIILEPD